MSQDDQWFVHHNECGCGSVKGFIIKRGADVFPRNFTTPRQVQIAARLLNTNVLTRDELEILFSGKTMQDSLRELKEFWEEIGG